jgi:hypothetical protein
MEADMRSRPDLIVPIRDRRQRRRVLTLRNVRNVLFAVTVIFVAATLYFEARGSRGGDYGRLYSAELPPRVAHKPAEVVSEATPAVAVQDATNADPLLVEPMAREQWLRAEATPAPITSVALTPATPQVQPQEGDLTISGGPEGIVVARAPRRRVQLSGGFGR